MSELCFLSASELARRIRKREISAVEATEAYLRRIEEVNPKLNAVVRLEAERAMVAAKVADAVLARGQVRGPLHGVPMTIKDSFDTAGVVSTAATLGRAKHVPQEDAAAVGRVHRAGAILLGKTNTSELTLYFEPVNLLFGATNNPYDLSRTAGGSSGGAAAMVAAGGAAFDLGSDTGGSIRLPAHFCGVAGIKATTGLVPKTGHIISFGGANDPLTHIGPLARSVEDLHLILSVIAGPDGRDPSVVPMPLRAPQEVRLRGLRVAMYTDNGIHPPAPATATTIRNAADVLAEAGAEIVEDRPEPIGQSTELLTALMRGDGGAWVRRIWAKCGTTETHPNLTWADETRGAGSRTTALTGALTGAEFLELTERWDRFRSEMLAFLMGDGTDSAASSAKGGNSGYDAILCPANAYPALPHGETSSPANRPAFSYTMTYNLTGWPAVVVRAGTSPEGLPIAAQVVARPWREDVALALAQEIESGLGGWQRPPI